MKKYLLNSFIILFTLVSLSLFGQENPKGYRVEGDEIVFSFDKREYDKATLDNTNNRLNFDDLNIQDVVVSGNFNDWSRHDWKMTKINENIYELRKNINDFKDEFAWEFKYVINNSYWAEPSKKDINSTRAKINGLEMRVYNLKMYTAYPSEFGNATFRLKGYEKAKKVILAGSFNKWDENLFKMEKCDGSWEITLQIKPGIYEYKFIVDGEWMEDKNNPSKIENEFDGYNSVVSIVVPITFKLQGYQNAEKVILAGSFNNWSKNKYNMTKTEDGWNIKIMLPGGKHHYKFIIDGEWTLDPTNTVSEYDEEGNINSVCMVK